MVIGGMAGKAPRDADSEREGDRSLLNITGSLDRHRTVRSSLS